MRTRIFAAVILSLILVLGAFWFRFSPKDSASTSLSLVEQPEEAGSYYNLLKTSSSTPSDTISTAELSNTDLISRQLFTDYIALSASGQATPETLEALANKYVDGIPTLATATQYSYTDLKSVTNTRANLVNYSEAIGEIYSDYARKLLSVESGGNIAALFSSGSGETPNKMKVIYQNTAAQLKALPVPTILIATHLALANLYLENAAAMASLATIQADPASAFAGLLMMSENINQEAEMLIKIQQTLTSNGI